MKIPCLFLLLAAAVLVSLGEAKKDERRAFALESSPKALLQRALVERLHHGMMMTSPQQLRGFRQLEGDDEEDEGEENNDENEDNENEEQEDEDQDQDEQDEAEQEDEDNQNNNNNNNQENDNNHDNDDGANWYDDASQYDDAYVEDEPEPQTLIQRFNSMSRSSKIWTIVLIVWAFIVLFACLIMCVRGCTEKRNDVNGKKQPLMSSRSLGSGTHNSDGSSNGRTQRKGWFARMGDRNREKLERRNRSRSRSRGRSRSRSRGRN